MIARRTVWRGGLALSTTALLAACHHAWTLNPQDVSVRGHFPNLQFQMTNVATGKIVTQANFRGFVTLVYFGYANCPDVCPLTLAEMLKIIGLLGDNGPKLRFLFVTVDPERDTAPILAKYLHLFGAPELVGLRGNATQLSHFAQSLHADYAVHPSANPADYTVTHSAAVYVFNQQGKAEFICAGLSAQHPDIAGITRDLRHAITTDAI
ncbi:protein SCO1 [Acidiphilium sp. MT5]